MIALLSILFLAVAGWAWWRFEDRQQRAEAERRYGPAAKFDAKKEGFRPYGFPGPAGLPPHRMPGSP